MNNLFKHLFTFSLVLVAIGFAFPLQANGDVGPPIIRKESQGGGGQHDCVTGGSTSVLHFSVALEDTTAYLADCDLYVGYDLLTSSPVYIAVDNFVWDPIEELYIFNFSILISSAEATAMCNQQVSTIAINTYCLVDGEYLANFETNPNGSSHDIDMCCNYRGGGDGLTGDDGANTRLLSTQETTQFVLDTKIGSVKSNEIQEKPLEFVDYYLFDISGNLVHRLNNASTQTSLQEAISNTNLRTGIYFVRYWDGNKRVTKKIFKN